MQSIKYTISIFVLISLYFVPNIVFAAGFFDAIGSLLTSIVAYVAGILVSLVVAVTTIFGVIFDYAITATISDFSQYFGSIQEGVNFVWKIFRDLANLVFIGMFIYIAFAVLIDKDEIQPVKQITQIVIIAILINFSLFFTKLAFDVSNIAAIQFYNMIRQDNQNLSISQLVIEKIGLTKFGQTDSFVSKMFGNAIGDTVAVGEDSGIIATLIYTSIVIIISFILISLFATAIYFLFLRAIAFIILMITSPIAFVSQVIPQMKGNWERWKDTLFKQAIYAPAFMAMIYGAVAISQYIDGDFVTLIRASAGDFSSAYFAQAIVNIALVLGIFYAAVNIPEKLSLVGAQKAKQIHNSLLKMALRTTPAYGALRAGYGGMQLAGRKVGVTTDRLLEGLQSLNSKTLKSAKINEALAKTRKNLQEGKYAPTKLAGIDKALAGAGFAPLKSMKEKSKAEEERKKEFAQFKAEKEIEKLAKEVSGATEKAESQVQNMLAQEKDKLLQGKTNKQYVQETNQAIDNEKQNLESKKNSMTQTIQALESAIRQEQNKRNPDAVKLAQLQKDKTEMESMRNAVDSKLRSIKRLQQELAKYAQKQDINDEEFDNVLALLQQHITDVSSVSTDTLKDIHSAISQFRQMQKSAVKQIPEIRRQILHGQNLPSSKQELIGQVANEADVHSDLAEAAVNAILNKEGKVPEDVKKHLGIKKDPLQDLTNTIKKLQSQGGGSSNSQSGSNNS